MERSKHAQAKVTTVPQADSPIQVDPAATIMQGGVAIATILSITLLVKQLVRLIEVSRADD